MQISITFKSMNPSEAVKSHVQEKFEKLDKMLDAKAEAHVVLSVEKLRNIADINLTCDKIKINATQEAENNMYAAIDALAENVKLQIRKLKDKQRKHLSGDKDSIKNNGLDMAPDADDND